MVRSTPGNVVEADRLRAALFTAALLENRRDLTYERRSLVIANVPAFDLGSRSEIIEGVSQGFGHAGLDGGSVYSLSPKRWEEARSKTEDWIRQGVFLVSRESVVAADENPDEFPPVLFAFGNRHLLGQPTACILNSRKPRAIAPSDSWIIITKALFREAVRRVSVVVSSFGTLPYALVSRLSCACQAGLIVACDHVMPFLRDGPKREDFLCRHQDLFRPERTLFLSPFPPGPVPPATERWRQRDNLVVALSSLVFVAAVRAGGNMEKVLTRAVKRKIRVAIFVPDRPDPCSAGNLSFLKTIPRERVERIEFRTCQHTVKMPKSNSKMFSARRRGPLELKNWPAKDSCLIHYTRSCHGPWPGESLAEYCQSIIDCRESAAHSGFHTLVRILEERRIRASRRLTRGNVPVVSFTECLPSELEKLVKWRKGLIRWSFEPYGVAVQRETLSNLGAASVIYGREHQYKDLPDDRKHLFQLRGSAGKDWIDEREWRLRADLSLEALSCGEITVIVAEIEEARTIRDRFGYDVTLAGLPSRPGKR